MTKTTEREETRVKHPWKTRGRGAFQNPTGRFESVEVIPDPPDSQAEADESCLLATKFFKEPSRKVVTFNDSPDVGFDASVNPYRGCEHGCIYCYARPTHEYFGLSCGLDFETKIFVKTDAPALLRKALSARSWKPQVIAFSGVTDPYQPVERKLRLTRQCLAVLAEFRNPVGIVTKNRLITRDLDILSELARFQAVQVLVSITTLDEELARRMEPRASRPALRLEAIRQLSQAGIPVSVMMAPLIPGLTDAEIDRVLAHAAQAGARSAHYTVLRLPYGVKNLFQTWLETHYPSRTKKVLNRIREVRGGTLNDPRFGDRMRGEGVYSNYLSDWFDLCRRRHGLDCPMQPLSTAAFQRPGDRQLPLF